MKKINIKLILADDEMSAISSMAASVQMTVREYVIVCMKLGHSKVVSDLAAAIEATKQETSDASI